MHTLVDCLLSLEQLRSLQLDTSDTELQRVDMNVPLSQPVSQLPNLTCFRFGVKSLRFRVKTMEKGLAMERGLVLLLTPATGVGHMPALHHCDLFDSDFLCTEVMVRTLSSALARMTSLQQLSLQLTFLAVSRQNSLLCFMNWRQQARWTASASCHSHLPFSHTGSGCSAAFYAALPFAMPEALEDSEGHIVRGSAQSVEILAVCMSNLTYLHLGLHVFSMQNSPEASERYLRPLLHGMSDLQYLDVSEIPAFDFFAAILGQMTQLTYLRWSLRPSHTMRISQNIAQALGCVPSLKVLRFHIFQLYPVPLCELASSALFHSLNQLTKLSALVWEGEPRDGEIWFAA